MATNAVGDATPTMTPTGYGPDVFHRAYGVPATSTSTVTIGVIEGYDNPNAKADLDFYDKQYTLGDFPTCDTATQTGCFQKVDANGGTSYPKTVGENWALESDLDLQTAHQMCLSCKILLVESVSSSTKTMLNALDRAVAMGATVVTSSYGYAENNTERNFDSHFAPNGVAYTFSSGNKGYGTQYPAASPYVTAVGGTTLSEVSPGVFQEKVWSGSGSGCSLYEPKPTFQVDTGCRMRTVADVAADADPATGAAVYDSVGISGQPGWFKVGGTSLASPLIAGMYAQGGIPASARANALPYGHLNLLTDIVDGGTNGTCSIAYLCTALRDYDGPTGLGTPIGTGAF